MELLFNLLGDKIGQLEVVQIRARKRAPFSRFFMCVVLVSSGEMTLDLSHDNSVNFGRILKCFILLEFARPLLESYRIRSDQNRSKSIEMYQNASNRVKTGQK